ncbi:MAG: SUMF1/EgtB/PvdO family nonheme iron enzyme [Rhodospirillaceae bacterium]
MVSRLIINLSALLLYASALSTDARATVPPEVIQDCADCPKMVVLPSGRFVFGANDQRDTYGPAQDVAIPYRFAIAATEITFDQYEVCVEAGGCAGNKSDHGWGRGTRPIINVAWQDAVDYAAWLSEKTGESYRLPSEQEWEYAARGGSVTRFPWGDEVGSGHANCRKCGTKWSGTGSAPVAQFAPNGFGLFDMSGNVSEWVADCWTQNHGALEQLEVESPQCTSRVTRGGDWYYVPILATSAARKPNAQTLWSYTIGFRVVRDLGS